MHAPRHRAVARRGATAVLAVATFYVFGVMTLTAWAFVPSVIGWTPLAISSASMTPRIAVGDVVVVDRYDGRDLAPGTVVTFRQGDRLVTHRIHEVTGYGYVTKGDANHAPDSTLVQTEAIVGTGRVLVPALARPLLWLQHDDHTPAAVWGLLTLTALIVLAAHPSPSTIPQTDRRPGPVVTAGAPVSPTWIARSTTAPRPAVRSGYRRPGTGLAAGPPVARHSARARWSGWLRRGLVAVLVTVLTGGLVGGWLHVAAAPLAGATTTTGDWTAALEAPTNLQGTAGCHNDATDAHIDLSWTANTHADGYDVFRTTDPGAGYTNIARVAGGATDQYRDTTVVEGTYHYQLEATSASVRSAPSESVEVVVTASALPCL